MIRLADCTSHHFACVCREAHFDAVAQRHLKVEAENERLKRIIAKELSENDKLGAEFTYVTVLKAEVARYREALKHAGCYCRLVTPGECLVCKAMKGSE